MKKFLLSILGFVCFVSTLFAGQVITIDFSDETFGAPSKYFSAFVGKWYIDKDEKNLVYAVDGRKWKKGVMAEGITQKAKALYGEQYTAFIDNLKAYRYFPLTIFKKCKNFTNGIISVNFKTISGRIDQAAGIAFNIKKNGDYLVVRANPLERNLILFKLEKGHRYALQWINRVPEESKKWYTLKVVIKGNRIQGYLNNKKYIDYKYPKKLSGKIGLWSKADSYVFFDNFNVIPEN